MERVVLNATKEVMQSVTFLSFSCDEITSRGCQLWINAHGYIARDWKRIPLFITLERVVEGGTTNNCTTVIVNVVHVYEGLSNQKIRKGLITFGVDGVSTYQGVKSGFIVKLINKHTPFMVGVYCMAHHTNLVVQTLSKLKTVRHVEDLW